MPRTAARFTQADVARAIRATRDAGVVAQAVDIMPDGRISVRLQPEPAKESAAPERKAATMPRKFGEG